MNYSNFSSLNYELINKKIKNGKKLRLDIGTSISAPVTRYWFNNLEDIYVIGIEPNPDCLDKENFWQNNFFNIKKMFENHPQGENYYHIIGACDNVEKLTEQEFYLLSGNVGCSSLLRPKYENINGCSLDKIINVETFSIFSLLENIICDTIELIKVDTQGKDLDVIKGMKNKIKNVCYIDLEDDSTFYYHNASSHSEIIEYMRLNDFDLYQAINGNLRFINKNIRIPKNYNNITGDM